MPLLWLASWDCWKILLLIQSTLDIVDFSVTRQKSTISSFSTIRNYFWGQRSNIPQIIGKLKEGCAISNIMLRVIGCKQSWHQFLINFSKIPDSKFLSYTTKMKNTFAKIQKKCQKNAIFPKKLTKITNKSLKIWLHYSYLFQIWKIHYSQ